MHDILEQFSLDPGLRTFGELVQEQMWAKLEICHLRPELTRLRDRERRSRPVSAAPCSI
jgi:hypothetical protein